MLSTLISLLAVGLVALIAVGIVLSLLGFVFSLAFGVASFVLFKVAPVVFLGWLVLKVFDSGRSKRQISAADRAWLEGRQ